MRYNVQMPEPLRKDLELREDPQVEAFLRLQPEDLDTYLAANANTLAGVRWLLKLLIRVVLRLAAKNNLNCS